MVGDFFLHEVDGLLDEETVLLLRVVLFDPLGHQVGEHGNRVLAVSHSLLHLRAVEVSEEGEVLPGALRGLRGNNTFNRDGVLLRGLLFLLFLFLFFLFRLGTALFTYIYFFLKLLQQIIRIILTFHHAFKLLI